MKGKGEEEVPSKKINLTREGRVPQCGRCSGHGHNNRSCLVPGVSVYRPPNKQSASVSASCHGGPNQPSQNSHFD